MLKAQPVRIGSRLFNTLRLLLIILCLVAVLVVPVALLLATANITPGQTNTVYRSIGPVCPSGETQVTRYAGQSTSMGCSCRAGYSLETGTGPLGPVEWEVCQ